MDFIYFLGRFHVLLLHLPIGILTLAIVFELLVRFRPFKFLTPVISWTWLAGGVSGIGAVILGFMHATEAGFQDSPAVEAHRWSGIILTSLGLLIFVLRVRLQPLAATAWPSWARSGGLDKAYDAARPVWSVGGALDRAYDKAGWIAACAATFVMLFITGHLGGNLTHGETYLVQYAPKPIRRLAGLSAETDPRPVPKDLASADIYLDVVAPALHARCDACHNDGKKSGGLSIANYDALMKGGKVGPVIVPGDPAKSDLFHRISLSPSDKDFMPQDGKTPLTPEQTAAIQVWIAAGAPKSGLIGAIKLADAQKAILQKALPTGEATAAAEDEAGLPIIGAAEPLPSVPAPDATAVAALENSGFIVRPVSKSSPLVNVDFAAMRKLAPADFANLAKIAPQIRTLNLRSGGVGDADLKIISSFVNLSQLRLEDNPITDAGLAALTPLKSLTYLNLVGSKVTDAGLAQLSALPKLNKLYVWGTAVTPAGVERVKADHKGAFVYAGLKPSDVPTDEPVKPPVN